MLNWQRLGLVLAWIIIFTGCTRLKQLPSSALGGASNSSIEESTLGVAFLSADQMLKSMVSATGVEGLGELTTTADNDIDKTYNERSGSLPSLQNLNQATGPTMIAVTNLASTICAKAVDRDRATSDANSSQRLFFREMKFGQGLGGQTSDAVTKAFERLARNSWRRGVSASDTDGINSFAQEFSTGVSSTDTNQTRNLAISICTAVISSIDGLTY